MVWFKVDDKIHGDRHARRAGVAAMGLWAMAGAWSGDQLTDGFVPHWVPDSLGADSSMVDKLVTAGLWRAAHDDENDEDGWQFVVWAPDQRLRADVEAERAATNERQKVHRDPALKQAVRDRDGDTCQYCSVEVSWRDRRGPQGGTYDHVDPTGGSVIDNVVVCCRACNARKSRRTPEESGMYPKASQNGARSGVDPSRFGAKSEPVTGSVTPGRVGSGRDGSGEPRSSTPVGEPIDVTAQLLAGP